MSASLRDALWAGFKQYTEEGLSCRDAALSFRLSPATGARWALAIRHTTGRAKSQPCTVATHMHDNHCFGLVNVIPNIVVRKPFRSKTQNERTQFR